MTNAEKFKEVFGVEPDTECMAIKCPEYVQNCKYWNDGYKCHCEEWWQEECKGHDV